MIVVIETQFNGLINIAEVLSDVPLDAAEIIEGKITELMELPKTGKPYKHLDGSVREASAEGEAPGINSKDLVGSFESIALNVVEAQIYSEIADLSYGAILEEKRNRPVTMPAIALAEPEIEKMVEDLLKEKWL